MRVVGSVSCESSTVSHMILMSLFVTGSFVVEPLNEIALDKAVLFFVISTSAKWTLRKGLLKSGIGKSIFTLFTR